MSLWSSNNNHNTCLSIRLNIHFREGMSAVGRPGLLETEIKTSEQPQEIGPLAPMPYFTDALVGLSAYKLLVHSKDSLSSNEEALAALLWQRLEPMHEVYYRASQRIQQWLGSKSTNAQAELIFEQEFRDILRTACSSEGTKIHDLLPLIEALNQMETRRSHPLLFDTKIQLTASTINILQTLHSLLYNLRAISAIHYNTHRADPLFDGLQLDTVKDYFHAPDLLTNESMLYYHIQSHLGASNSERKTHNWINDAFLSYLPQSHFLVNALPEEFFANKGREQLEQDIYTFQIDWLLGSPAGLLYRLREELIGLREGYDQTFWPELQNEIVSEPTASLAVNCILDSEHIRQLSDVA